MTSVTDTFGPFEFLLLAFPGNAFTGAITPALAELIEDQLIRVVDLAVVSKAADGSVTLLELQELTPELADAVEVLAGEDRGLLSEADLLEVAEDLPPETTAAALLVEHIWATRLAGAIRQAKGELLLAERIPHAVIAEARETLLAAAAAAAL